MGEILFRGQTRRLGEKVWMNGEKVPSNWVYGGICHGKYAFSIIYGSMDEERENPVEKHVVYTDTVGQFTGLTDKNGKKIFEGDIVHLTDVRYDNEWKAVVVFGNPYGEYSWGWNFLYIGEKPKVATDILLWAEMDDVEVYCEIIGNIYDNPELLKGE